MLKGVLSGAAGGAASGSIAGPMGTVAGGVLGALGSIAGGLFGSNSQKKLTKMNIDLQREFAQHGIQWRVEDAKRAGIHPAAALGAFPVSANPIVMEDPMGRAIADAGQDISGAVTRTMNTDQRLNGRLQNDLILSQIRENDARTAAIQSDTMRKATESGPAFPMITQEGTGGIPSQDPNVPGTGLPGGFFKLDIPTRFNSRVGDPSIEPGGDPAAQEVDMPGFKMIMPTGKGQSVWETWGELPVYEKWGWIMHNAYKQGSGWLDKYVDFMITGATMQDRFKNKKPILPMNDTEKALRRSLDKAVGAGRKYLNMSPEQIRKNFLR